MDRDELVATICERLDAIQSGLFDKALAMRQEHTRTIEDEATFREYFTPENAERPEIHGGFASCYFEETPELEKLLAELKVTIRCIPLDEEVEPGRCFFSGAETSRRAIFAKAY